MELGSTASQWTRLDGDKDRWSQARPGVWSVRQERRESVYEYYTSSIVLLSLQLCFCKIVQLLIFVFWDQMNICILKAHDYGYVEM